MPTVTSTRHLPANYVAHSARDFGRKGWTRTLLNLASFLAWLMFSLLLLWIAVRLHSDPQKDSPVFGQAEGLVGVVVVTAFLFGVATAMHQAIHGAGYWLFTQERPRFVLSGGYLSVSAPGWYLGRPWYAIMLLAPLIVWAPVTFAAIAFIPAPTIYWLAVTLALNIALCTSDLSMLIWVLRQPRRTLFSDHDGDTGTTAWAPTI